MFKFARMLQNLKRAVITKFQQAFCLYYVVNESFYEPHYCFTFKGALDWCKCYDSESFGPTSVFSYNGFLIAQVK